MEQNANQTEPLRKIKQIKIAGKIELLSGMRIGGSETLLEIGGVDAGQTCIKHPTTYKPYIPGSSLKGKMRSEMEKKLGRYRIYRGRDGQIIYEPCDCAGCLVCRVFGPHKVVEHDLGPTRLLVRDCQVLEKGDFEVKSSTAINRKTNTALGGALRTEERVVAGAIFDFRVDLQIWNIDKDCEYEDKKGEEALVEFVKECLRLVEQTGLGAGTSKGFGLVKFHPLEINGETVSL
jgi:CRISPR-associated protein Csm3